MNRWNDQKASVKDRWNGRAGTRVASEKDWEILRIITFTDNENPFAAVREEFPGMKRGEIAKAAKRAAAELYEKGEGSGDSRGGSLSLVVLRMMVEKMQNARLRLKEVGLDDEIMLNSKGGDVDNFKLYMEIAMASQKTRVITYYKKEFGERGIS